MHLHYACTSRTGSKFERMEFIISILLQCEAIQPIEMGLYHYVL